MWPELTASDDLASVLSVLSAMITPAVLILASGSLIMTTSSRLMRCIDRVREMAAEIETLADAVDGARPPRYALLYAQLQRNTRRARVLQHALVLLYGGISFFVATSVAIGIVALLRIDIGYVPILLGFFGAGFLFVASVVLIAESRLALATTYAEMDYIAQHYVQPR